jgi:hypothetical protein
MPHIKTTTKIRQRPVAVVSRANERAAYKEKILFCYYFVSGMPHIKIQRKFARDQSQSSAGQMSGPPTKNNTIAITLFPECHT